MNHFGNKTLKKPVKTKKEIEYMEDSVNWDEYNGMNETNEENMNSLDSEVGMTETKQEHTISPQLKKGKSEANMLWFKFIFTIVSKQSTGTKKKTNKDDSKISNSVESQKTSMTSSEVKAKAKKEKVKLLKQEEWPREETDTSNGKSEQKRMECEDMAMKIGSSSSEYEVRQCVSIVWTNLQRATQELEKVQGELLLQKHETMTWQLKNKALQNKVDEIHKQLQIAVEDRNEIANVADTYRQENNNLQCKLARCKVNLDTCMLKYNTLQLQQKSLSSMQDQFQTQLHKESILRMQDKLGWEENGLFNKIKLCTNKLLPFKLNWWMKYSNDNFCNPELIISAPDPNWLWFVVLLYFVCCYHVLIMCGWGCNGTASEQLQTLFTNL
ncbi:janus kinase and microtubule interacting protein 1-like protein [Reticulomyxa filosa]|uniref:Janus kinase and microtubule interacting protein 1-like protein n=1 Tax=Reticulomyxa filosa TaxID=46433 RepID=X6N9G5_RETFI|nr:janus kinase and microtubule interacting protein 1-like protein [Reticulomyxa filosa]|eukprot:ETO22925.1 janus kinase and microtubule interacting protein 1-like protein [Reticulomyxa filosa]